MIRRGIGEMGRETEAERKDKDSGDVMESDNRNC